MSVFTLVIAPVPSQPGRRAVIFNPIVSGRSYTVKFKPDLAAGTWATLTGTTQSDNFATRTVTDLNVSDPERFSQIEITKP